MASGDPRSSLLRVRHRIAQNLWIAVALCLLLAAAGGFVAYEEYTAPDTTTEQRTTATWTTDSEFTHSATVTRSSRAFAAGAVLHNRSVYLSSVSPELTGEHRFRHRGDVERATATTNVTLVKRSVTGTGDEQTELWRVSEPLSATESTLGQNETASTGFRVNVSEQRNETREIERELGGAPGRVEMFVRVTTRVTATVEDRRLNRTRTDRLTIELGQSAYSVSTNETGEREKPIRRETVTVPVEKNATRIYGGTAFAAVWLVAAAGLAYAGRREVLPLAPDVVAAVERARTRDRFDEWISVGRVPEPSARERLVTVDSLEDLVDVAIDSDRRVIEDAEDERFVVIDGQVWYCFEFRDRSVDAEDGMGDDSNGVTDAGDDTNDEPVSALDDET